jgi:hypothetical protein
MSNNTEKSHSKNFNILIGGMPRSGKTTLAHTISKEFGLSHISQSSLHPAFKKFFPDLQIHSDGPSYDHIAHHSAPFYFEQCNWYARHNMRFIGDGYYFRPSHILSMNFHHGVIAIFMGYAQTDINYAFEKIRSQEKSYDWTKNCSDQELRSDLVRFRESSLQLKELAEENCFMYFDLNNDWDKGRYAAYEYLRQKCIDS